MRSTISSACSLSGNTTPSRAWRNSARIDARERGRDACELVGDLVDGGEIEVVAEAQRDLVRDAPVVHRGAFRSDLAADPLYAAFEIGDAAGLLAPQRAREHDLGPARRAREERARPRSADVAPAMPRCARSLSGKSATGSEPNTTSTSILPSAAAVRMPSGVEPGRRRVPGCPTRSSNHSRPASSETRSGQEARRRGRRRSRRARCRGGAPTGNTRRRRGRGNARAWPIATAEASASDGPSTTITGPGRSARARAIASSASDPSASPGIVRMTSAVCRLSVCATGARSTSGTPSSTAARRTRRCSTGSASSRSAPSSTMAAARSQSAICARGSPSISSAGNPSPICASTLSVPITPFISRANA